MDVLSDSIFHNLDKEVVAVEDLVAAEEDLVATAVVVAASAVDAEDSVVTAVDVVVLVVEEVVAVDSEAAVASVIPLRKVPSNHTKAQKQPSELTEASDIESK